MKVAVLVLLFCLMAGGLELHGAGGGPHSEIGGTDRFTPAASHPHQPRHVEAGSEAGRPACIACLYSLATRATPPTRAATPRVTMGSARLWAEPDLLPAAPCSFWADGRSPPLA